MCTKKRRCGNLVLKPDSEGSRMALSFPLLCRWCFTFCHAYGFSSSFDWELAGTVLLCVMKVSLHRSAIFASKGVPESEKSKILAISDIKFTFNLERDLGFCMFHGRIIQHEFSDVMASVQCKNLHHERESTEKTRKECACKFCHFCFSYLWNTHSVVSPVYLGLYW
jgi:hypothetical protein